MEIELRQKAKAASPGPHWQTFPSEVAGTPVWAIYIPSTGEAKIFTKDQEDAEFIAALDPQTVIGILDAWQEAVEELRRVQEGVQRIIDQRYGGDFAPILPKLAELIKAPEAPKRIRESDD